MERVRKYTGLMILAVLAWVWTLPAQAMNKAELIEAMASEAGLSKEDAGSFIDNFSTVVSDLLCPRDKCGVEESPCPGDKCEVEEAPCPRDKCGVGDPLVLSGFGAFRVIPGMDARGRLSGGEVEFVPGRAFQASDEVSADAFTMTVNRTMTINRAGWPGDLDSDGDGLPDLTGDDLVVLGDGMGPVRAGDVVVINDPPRGNSGKRPGGAGMEVKVAAVVVDCCKPLVIDVWERGTSSAGLILRGIDKKDIRRGMRITTSPDQPGDESIVLSRLSERCKDDESCMRGVSNSYITLLTLIVDEVNAGGSVEVGNLGQFFQEARATVQVVDVCGEEICRVEHEVELGVTGESPETVAAMASSISKRSARTGRNPQTGKEIQVTTENRVKFKAGAELSK
ncbi:MAG: HU family DNA-binding protein [Pseudomonadota bacterium]